MKKATLVLVAIGLLVTACSTAGSIRSGSVGAGALQPLAELAAGTLKLDGTADAITKEQAAELLPLWEVYKEIGMSDTVAQQEIDGLSAQIQEAMTDAQLESIRAMKLTQEDAMGLMRPEGPAMSTGGSNPGGSARSNGGMPGGQAPSGGFPGGDMPPDAAMGSGGLAGGSQGTGTPQANGQLRPTGARAGAPTGLVNAVVEYLRTKANG